MKRILREPLFQFLVIGAIVFLVYAMVQNRAEVGVAETIVVTPGRVAQLVETFSRTWQRPPTRDELGGLIDAFVKEEIFYREGRKLGLDTDDTVFRRRLQQKMEFLMEPGEAELTPADGELQAYLDAHRDMFRIPEYVAFEQVFFDPARHGETVEADALQTLAALRSGEGAPDPDSLGDPTLLPATMPLSPIDRVAISFGDEFADALAGAPVGAWTGPVRSTFGLHLVRVDDSRPARDPALAEVADEVGREWETARRAAIMDERYAELRKRYEVVVEAGPAADRPAGGSAAQ